MGSTNTHVDGANAALERSPETLPALPRFYKRNLFSIIVVGMVFGWWVYNFTNWFEIFSGLLALSGIFSWLAFVTKILPEYRLKGLQTWVDERVLAWPWTVAIVVSLGAVLLVVTAWFGTLEVQALRTSALLRVHEPSATEKQNIRWNSIAAGARLRFTFPVSRPWGTVKVTVKVSGLPERIETIRGFKRQVIQVPDSFRRPALLIRPAVSLAQYLANSPVKLIVRYRGEQRRIEEFRGQSLWINCDADVEIPPETIADWKSELIEKNAETLLKQWETPLSLDPPHWDLQAGSQVQFEFHDQRDHLQACAGNYTVQALPERADARQVGVLDEKPSTSGKCGSILSITK